MTGHWLVPWMVVAAVALAGCRDDSRAQGGVRSASSTSAAQRNPPPPRGPASPADPADSRNMDGDDVETVDDEVEPEATDHPGACAPKDPSLKPMQLLRFAFASGIEGRDPKDKLDVVHAGRRVYAHLTIRNRSGRERCLHLTFSVAGKKRTSVTLKIGKSWSWRTWAYNTLRADDRAPLKLVVTDDQGTMVLTKLLAVIPQ